MSNATFRKLNKKAQTRPAPSPGISQTSITLITFALVAIAIYFIIRSQPGLATEGQGLITQISASLKKSGIDISGTFNFLKKIITDPKGFAEEEIFSDQAQKELEQVKNPGVEIQKLSAVIDPVYLGAGPGIDPAIQGLLKAVSIERKLPICVKLWASIDANQNLYMNCTKGGISGSDDPSICPQIPEVDAQKIFILNGPRFPNSPFACTISSQEILQALPTLSKDATSPLQTQVNLAYSYKAHAQKQVFIADKNIYFQVLARDEDPLVRFNIDSTKIRSYSSKGPINLGIGIGAGGELTDLILSETTNFLTLQVNNQGDGTIKLKDVFILLSKGIALSISQNSIYNQSAEDNTISTDYCSKMRPRDTKCMDRIKNLNVIHTSEEKLKQARLIDEDGFLKETKTIPLAIGISKEFLSGLEVSSMTIIAEISYEYHQKQSLTINVRKIPSPEEEAQAQLIGETEREITPEESVTVQRNPDTRSTSTGTYSLPIIENDPQRLCITSKYGNRILNGRPDFHYGLDLRCRNPDRTTNKEIKSISQGVVIAAIDENGNGAYIDDNIPDNFQDDISKRIARERDRTALGKRVHVCDFITGNCIIYAHLSSYSVSPGDSLTLGDTIGICGSTGNVDGPHLHLQIHDIGPGKTLGDVNYGYGGTGTPTNPEHYFSQTLQQCS